MPKRTHQPLPWKPRRVAAIARGPLANEHRRAAGQGMTLIEIMVVVVIIGFMAGVVTLSMGAAHAAKLRSSCWLIASGARYAYSYAVTHGKTTRLVLDFDKGTIGIEEASGRVVLTREDETGEGLGGEADADADGGVPAEKSGSSLLDRQMDAIGGSLGGGSSATASSGNSPLGGMLGGMLGGSAGMSGGGKGTSGSGQGGLADLMGGMDFSRLTDPFLAAMGGAATGPGNSMGYRRPRFKKLPGRRGEKRELEGNCKEGERTNCISFKEVQTPHEPQPRTEGRAFIYFFPGGLTEHSIIKLTNGDTQVQSIEIHPLTGLAQIHDGDFEVGEELDELQEAEP